MEKFVGIAWGGSAPLGSSSLSLKVLLPSTLSKGRGWKVSRRASSPAIYWLSWSLKMAVRALLVAAQSSIAAGRLRCTHSLFTCTRCIKAMWHGPFFAKRVDRLVEIESDIFSCTNCGNLVTLENVDGETRQPWQVFDWAHSLRIRLTSRTATHSLMVVSSSSFQSPFVLILHRTPFKFCGNRCVSEISLLYCLWNPTTYFNLNKNGSKSSFYLASFFTIHSFMFRFL